MSMMRGDPAGGGGPGGGGEALPLGAARLVDVHVGVDQPGQQRQVAEVARRRHRVVRLDRGDPAVARPRTAAGRSPSGSDHPPGPQDQVDSSATSSVDRSKSTSAGVERAAVQAAQQEPGQRPGRRRLVERSRRPRRSR